jgi:hypothetical protein
VAVAAETVVEAVAHAKCSKQRAAVAAISLKCRSIHAAISPFTAETVSSLALRTGSTDYDVTKARTNVRAFFLSVTLSLSKRCHSEMRAERASKDRLMRGLLLGVLLLMESGVVSTPPPGPSAQVDMYIGGCSENGATEPRATVTIDTLEGKKTANAQVRFLGWKGGFAHYEMISPWHVFKWLIKTKGCTASGRGAFAWIEIGEVGHITSMFGENNSSMPRGQIDCLSGTLRFLGMRVVAKQAGKPDAVAYMAGTTFIFDRLEGGRYEFDVIYSDGINRARFLFDERGMSDESCADIDISLDMLDKASSGPPLDITSMFIVKATSV